MLNASKFVNSRIYKREQEKRNSNQFFELGRFDSDACSPVRQSEFRDFASDAETFQPPRIIHEAPGFAEENSDSSSSAFDGFFAEAYLSINSTREQYDLFMSSPFITGDFQEPRSGDVAGLDFLSTLPPVEFRATLMSRSSKSSGFADSFEIELPEYFSNIFESPDNFQMNLT